MSDNKVHPWFRKRYVDGPPPKVVMLFGAGASAFSGCTYRDGKDRNPPLGRGPDGLFARLVAERGLAAGIHEAVREYLIADFETGMLLVEKFMGAWHIAFQREVALHLAGYSIRPDNLYRQMLGPEVMRSSDVLYSTINYDILLDQALNEYGVPIEGRLGDALDPPFVNLLKLHGACNVLIDVHSTIRGGGNYGSPFGLQSIVGGNVGDLYFAKDREEIARWCRESRNEAFAPLMAQYVRQKTFLTHQNEFARLQQFWSQRVETATTVILVGVRYMQHDRHIWGPLFDSEAELLVVDPYFDEIAKWGERRKRKPLHIAEAFADLAAIHNAVQMGLML